MIVRSRLDVMEVSIVVGIGNHAEEEPALDLPAHGIVTPDLVGPLVCDPFLKLVDQTDMGAIETGFFFHLPPGGVDGFFTHVDAALRQLPSATRMFALERQ